jgi:hypothetical protein
MKLTKEQQRVISEISDVAESMKSDIKTDKQLQDFANFLLKVRKTFNYHDETRKGLTEGQRAEIEKVNSEYKPTLEPLKAIEGIINGVVVRYVESRFDQMLKIQEQARADTGDKSLTIPLSMESVCVDNGEIRFKEKTNFSIEDNSKIPDEYYCLDEAKVNKAVAAGISIPGVKTTKSVAISLYVKE